VRPAVALHYAVRVSYITALFDFVLPLSSRHGLQKPVKTGWFLQFTVKPARFNFKNQLVFSKKLKLFTVTKSIFERFYRFINRFLAVLKTNR
jgi:hypothetical protein